MDMKRSVKPVVKKPVLAAMPSLRCRMIVLAPQRTREISDVPYEVDDQVRLFAQHHGQ